MTDKSNADPQHEKLMHYLIGQVKKKTKGKCSAIFVRQIFEEMLETEWQNRLDLQSGLLTTPETKLE